MPASGLLSNDHRRLIKVSGPMGPQSVLGELLRLAASSWPARSFRPRGLAKNSAYLGPQVPRVLWEKAYSRIELPILDRL